MPEKYRHVRRIEHDSEWATREMNPSLDPENVETETEIIAQGGVYLLPGTMLASGMVARTGSP